MTDEERIRERAHQIWEQEGRPAGRDKEYRERAARELGLTPEKPASGESIHVVAGQGEGPAPGGGPVTPLSGFEDQAPYASVDSRTERTG